MGGVVAGGLCICLAVCVCVAVCCCYQKKKKNSHSDSSTARVTMVQPPTVAIVSQTTTLDVQHSTKMPDYNLSCDRMCTLQGDCSVTYTVPAPYPTAGDALPPSYPPMHMAAETLPPIYPTAGGTLPPSYPAVAGGALPPAYSTPGSTLPTGYPPQQPYPAQPPDMPLPYPQAHFTAPQ